MLLKTIRDVNGLPTNVIKNKIIGIQTLKESSTAETYLSIFKDKLLSFGNDVQANLVGLTHDGAPCFSGNKNGLIAKLRDENQKFLFDLVDPCHSLSLALSSSLQTLPDDIKDFIDGIHHHFVSPQRKARLARIQANLGENKLLPKNYIKTRWLSLGESLSRLLKIWGSLIIYMETGKNEEGLKKFDFKYYLDLLQDQLFFLKIVFLTNIINRINETNIKLQSQSVEIQHLKSELLQLFQWMTKLIVMPEKIPQDALEIMNIDWKDETNIGDLLLNNDNFISYISEMIDVRLQKLQEKSIKKTTERIHNTFPKFN